MHTSKHIHRTAQYSNEIYAPFYTRWKFAPNAEWSFRFCLLDSFFFALSLSFLVITSLFSLVSISRIGYFSVLFLSSGNLNFTTHSHRIIARCHDALFRKQKCLSGNSFLLITKRLEKFLLTKMCFRNSGWSSTDIFGNIPLCTMPQKCSNHILNV